uniref:photoreceptor cilium actin regulator-like n=1 Tax=Pristiophorus japonicus TaxID=55135 RepID=UPI00398E38F1
MGCAPSQREIIQHLAKNTLRPLKKATALASADKWPAENLTHSISFGNSDSYSNMSEDVRENASGPGNKDERRRVGRGHGQHPPTVPARLSELWSEETEREKLPAGTKVAVAVASQKYAPQDMPVHKHEMYSDCHGDSNAAQPPKRTRKQKGRHAAKQTKSTKLRAGSGEDQEKVDFPRSLVTAHHAAYAYLNPSLCKYDAILSLTDQAAQTQLMVQQMVNFLTLRFEEVNQILEEIAAEGERLVKDVGPQLAWPVDTDRGGPEEQPDLLQQLLQYTVHKMQATNGTVSSLSAAALQEACGHMQAAADTLRGGLAARQQVDARLHSLLGQLEGCVWQRPRPGDTALYSEDSGIGADTESLKDNGKPERCGRRPSGDALPPVARGCAPGLRDSAAGRRLRACSRDGSATSFESGGSVEGEALSCSLDLGSAGEEDEGEAEESGLAPRRPSSSPPESGAPRPASPAAGEEMATRIKDAISHRIRFVPSAPASGAWSDDEGRRRPARPSTAEQLQQAGGRARRSRSAESLRSRAEDPTLLELQRTRKVLSRRLDKMLRAKEGQRRQASGPPDQHQKEEQEAARPKLPPGAPPPTNRLKASLRKDFSVLPSQGPGALRRRRPPLPPGQGTQAEAVPFKQDSPQLHERQAPQAGAGQSGDGSARPQRKSVRGLIDTFSQGGGGGGAEAGDGRGPLAVLDGTRRLGAPTCPSHHSATATLSRPGRTTQRAETPGPDLEDFPPPAALAMDGLKAGARVGEDACAASGACAVKEASGVSRVTVTQRLMASLDSVALLPSRHAGGGGRFQRPAAEAPWGGRAKSQEHSADSQRRLVAGQHWQPYKIINLRYAGASCGSAESGAAQLDPPAQHQQPVKGRPASPPGDSRVQDAGDPAPRDEGAGDNGRAVSGATRAASSPPVGSRGHRAVSSTFSSPAAARKTSPTKLTARSPPTDRKPASLPWQPGHLPRAAIHPAPAAPAEKKRFPSPPLQPKNLFRPIGYAAPMPSAARRCPDLACEPRHFSQALGNTQPSPPSLCKQLSPPASPRRLSPPTARKLPSPPSQRKLPSPPAQRKLPSPPVQRQLPSPATGRKLPSPPTGRSEASPPPSTNGASPPVSPGVLRKGPSDHFEVGLNSQWPTKIGSNALSIFSPASDSIFEAKSSSPPVNLDAGNVAGQSQIIILGDGSPMTSRAAWRNNFMLRQPSDWQRRLTLSGVHPQPFVKRNYLPDCRIGAQSRFPASSSAGSEPTLHSVGLDGNSENEGDPWRRHYVSDLRGSSRSVSHPELCIIGQGLQ